MSDGWIKLHRKILDHELMRDTNACMVFIFLLLSCDRKNGTYRSGRFRDSEFLGLKPTTFYAALKRLEKKYKIVDLVTGKMTIKYTLVTVKNWEKYQSNDSDDDNSMTIKRQSNDNQMTLNKNIRIKNKEINNIEAFSERELLKKIIAIVNPKEKPTDDRLRFLRGRLKDYTEDEVISAAHRFAKSDWHRQNGQLSIDNLLSPTKFGRWHAQEEKKSNKTIILD